MSGRSIEAQGMQVPGPGPMGYGYMPPHQQIPIHGIPPMYNGHMQNPGMDDDMLYVS